MKQYNKPLLALFIGAMTVMGAATYADARPDHPGKPFHHGSRYGDLTPELHQMIEKAYNDIAPLQLELRAKPQELTAKIYGGADDKTVQQLSSEVSALQKRVTDARVKMQQDFAKASVPMQYDCAMGGGRGFHGGMGLHGGMGKGSCPGFGPGYSHHGMMTGPGPALPDADNNDN